MAAERKVVLDASAIVAWMLKETGHRVVDRLMPVAVAPASAMTETLYRARQRGHHMTIPEAYQHLVAYGLRVDSVEQSDCQRAAELILQSRMSAGDSLSLGDGLCIAVAERLNLVITGSDRYWETLDLAVPFHTFR